MLNKKPIMKNKKFKNLKTNKKKLLNYKKNKIFIFVELSNN